MKQHDWRDRLNIVYSTDPDFEYEMKPGVETPPPSKQRLTVRIDKKQRSGKKVTLVEGFVGSAEDLKTLGKLLKTKCGAGGSVKDNEILIQGDFKDKIAECLIFEGYTVVIR
jgi:translation initiation factor 1